MSWFFVDDKFFAHPKLGKLSRAEIGHAVSLWTLSGAWSRSTLTGGHVPYHQVDALRCSYEGADALVKCGLWYPVDDGYQFHDWAQWQETPEEVERKRADARVRTQKWRSAKSKKSRQKRDASLTRHSRVGDARVPGEVEKEKEGDGTYKHEAREALAVDAESPASLAALVLLKAGAR